MHTRYTFSSKILTWYIYFLSTDQSVFFLQNILLTLTQLYKSNDNYFCSKKHKISYTHFKRLD